MKAKFLIVVLAALVLATGTVWAQKGHHNRRAEHKELTTEQVAKKMTDRMKENLSLSDEQVKQVYPICLEQAQAMREHRANAGRWLKNRVKRWHSSVNRWPAG